MMCRIQIQKGRPRPSSDVPGCLVASIGNGDMRIGMLLYFGAMLVMMTSMVFVAMPVGLVHLFLRWVTS